MRRPTANNRSRPARSAFTLIEVLVVVIVLGILAAIIIPSVAMAGVQSAQAAFVTELKTWDRAAQVFIARRGVLPEDSSSGVAPTGFELYADTEDFESGTPLGGSWDFEQGTWGVASAVGVHFDGPEGPQSDAIMTEIDAIFDDGDLTTGSFQKFEADRFYYIVVR